MFVFNWLLVQAKIFKNSFRENKKEFFFRDLWHAGIVLFGLVLVYVFLNSMFNFIDKKGMPAFDFSFVFLSFSLLVLLPLIFYSAVVCSLSFLFQKEENHFYFSLPVSRVSVFTVKLLQTYLHTVWMSFLGLVTFLAAVQHYFKVTPLVYITGSLSLLVFLFIPVCLAAILVIVISRFLPFVQAKGILTVIGLFVGSVLVAAIRLMQPERLVTPEGKMRLVTFVQNLHQPWMTVLPSEWVTNVLFAQIQKDLTGVMLNFLSLLVLASVLAAVVYILAGFFYERVWADAAAVSPSACKKSGWQALLNIFPSSLRAFIRKDLLSFYRDTVERGSLSILIPLSFVYFYSVYMLNRQLQNAGEDPLFSFLYIYLFNFFYSSVVISGLSGRWVFPSVSLEGDNFKLIKCSAVSLRDFLRAKFFLGFIPLLFFGEILILGSLSILGLPFSAILVSGLVMVLLCLGITLICLILGMKEADFSIKEPLEFALSYRGFLCLVWEGIFTVIVIILVGIPTAIFLSKGFSQSFALSLIIGLAVIFAALGILRRVYNRSLIALSRKEV